MSPCVIVVLNHSFTCSHPGLPHFSDANKPVLAHSRGSLGSGFWLLQTDPGWLAGAAGTAVGPGFALTLHRRRFIIWVAGMHRPMGTQTQSQAGFQTKPGALANSPSRHGTLRATFSSSKDSSSLFPSPRSCPSWSLPAAGAKAKPNKQNQKQKLPPIHTPHPPCTPLCLFSACSRTHSWTLEVPDRGAPKTSLYRGKAAGTTECLLLLKPSTKERPDIRGKGVIRHFQEHPFTLHSPPLQQWISLH